MHLVGPSSMSSNLFILAVATLHGPNLASDNVSTQVSAIVLNGMRYKGLLTLELQASEKCPSLLKTVMMHSV